jgi:hypothetical protein
MEDKTGGECSIYRAIINAYKVLLGKPELNIQPENLECSRRIILKWVLER